MHIELSVSGQRLRREMGPGIVGGSRYYLTAHVAFAGHDWDGCQVWLKIDRDGKQNAYLLDEAACVTAERGINLPAGQYTMSLLGLRDAVCITTNEVPLCVMRSGADGGDPLPEVPQTAAEQIALLAQEAANTARSVREDADAGLFDGEDGVSVQHRWDGSVLTITSASGTSSAELRGPQGPQGPEGPEGKQGPQGQAGKDAPQDAVRYGVQALTDEEQEQARANIGAGSAGELSRVKDDLDSKFSVKESVNLWNPETTVIGQLQLDGSVRTSATDYVTTDFIPYKACEELWLCFYRTDTKEITIVTPQASNGSILCLYDKNKNFLERLYSGFHGIRGYTIENADCAYIRYTYAYAYWSNPTRIYCLSKIDVENVEDFEEYYAPIVFLKNVTDPTNPTKVSELENDEGYIRESKYLNANIVSCRGDSLTDGAGATSGNTYPKLLKDLLGENYTVNNFGVGGEGTKAISWRFGATPIYLAPCTIPATGSVDCKVVDASGADVTFLLRGGMIPSNPSLSNFNVNPVIIGGVEGVLARSSTTANAYTFTRAESGAEVTLDRPTFISTYGYRNNTKDITIFWCGTNDTQTWKGYTYIINYLKQMIDLLPHKKYIVCGLTCLNYHADIATKNEQLSFAFGRHFLDLRYYLLNYGLADAGITPTENDETAIASGEMPPSLLYDNVHFNSNGYAVIANCIYRKGVELGYW